LPNIYDESQITEFARTSDCPPLTKDDLARIQELVTNNFGLPAETPNYKGTMKRAIAA
jgi:hypothetical protein